MKVYVYALLSLMLISCSAQKAVLKTLSNLDLATHHPVSIACFEVAKDLDSQLTLLKDQTFALEPIRKISKTKPDLVGFIIAEELAAHLTRLGYNISVMPQTVGGKASFDPENINVIISGSYYTSINRVSVVISALDAKSQIRLAASTVSILKTREVEDFLNLASKNSLFSFERVPLIDRTLF